jgi:hypothetical protein
VKVYSKNYWSVNASVFKAVKRDNIKNAVVFVRSYYGSVFVGNSPVFDGDIIYVRDLSVKNRLMMDYYRDKKYYIADGPEIAEAFPPPKDEVIIEAESLKVVDSSGDRAAPQKMKGYGPYWSDDSQILAVTDEPGDYIVLAVPVESDGMYEVSVCYTKAEDFAQVQLVINERPMGGVFDGYSKRVVHTGVLNMGETYLHKGENLFRFQVVGKNKAASNYRFGVDCFILRRVI